MALFSNKRFVASLQDDGVIGETAVGMCPFGLVLSRLRHHFGCLMILFNGIISFHHGVTCPGDVPAHIS